MVWPSHLFSQFLPILLWDLLLLISFRAKSYAFSLVPHRSGGASRSLQMYPRVPFHSFSFDNLHCLIEFQACIFRKNRLHVPLHAHQKLQIGNYRHQGPRCECEHPHCSSANPTYCKHRTLTCHSCHLRHSFRS